MRLAGVVVVIIAYENNIREKGTSAHAGALLPHFPNPSKRKNSQAHAGSLALRVHHNIPATDIFVQWK